jgi:hypothetical protein
LPEVAPLAPVAGIRISAVAKAWEDHRERRADNRLFLWGWLSLQQLNSRPSAADAQQQPEPLAVRSLSAPPLADVMAVAP